MLVQSLTNRGSHVNPYIQTKGITNLKSAAPTSSKGRSIASPQSPSEEINIREVELSRFNKYGKISQTEARKQRDVSKEGTNLSSNKEAQINTTIVHETMAHL